MAPWSTPFLRKFLSTCKSDAWRKEALHLLTLRERVTVDLQILNSKRARRQRRRNSQKAQLF